MSLTKEEVAKHNSKSSCWVILSDKVLDVTDFLKDHPGGELAILTFAGKDATEEFDMIHPPDVIDKYQADKKVTPCAFLPWVDRVGGQPPDGRRPVVRRPTDGRRTVVRPDVRAAPVSSAAPKKKSFDRGGPVWPPRSNVTNDRLGGGDLVGLCPPGQKPEGLGGSAP